MWMAIIAFLGGPVVSGLIKAYQAKLQAGNVESKIAADLAAGEIAAQIAETQAQAQLKIAEIGQPVGARKARVLCDADFLQQVRSVGHGSRSRHDRRAEGRC